MRGLERRARRKERKDQATKFQVPKEASIVVGLKIRPTSYEVMNMYSILNVSPITKRSREGKRKGFYL